MCHSFPRLISKTLSHAVDFSFGPPKLHLKLLLEHVIFLEIFMRSFILGIPWKQYLIIFFSMKCNGSSIDTQASRFRTWNMSEKYYPIKLQRGLVAHQVARSNEISTVYQSCRAKHIVNATSGQPLESEPGAYHPKNHWKSMQDGLNAFYRFSRPHTVIGTVRFNLL